MTLNVFDLFSGIGGFSLGLESVSEQAFKTIGFCEIDKPAQSVLRKHWNNVIIYDDIKNLKFYSTQGIDVLCGGFPCTDISVGKWNGERGIVEGNRSGLWFEFKRLINEAKPKYAIIENVYGILSSGLETVLQDLAEIGYDATWTTIDSQWTGVAQRRRRVYILAVRDGIPTGADIFRFGERSKEQLQGKLDNINEKRRWDFSESQNVNEAFAYFARTRSDQFSEGKIASTFTKRDYKQYTDIVVHAGIPRQVTPQERLVLQGFPNDWLDNLNLSKAAQFKLNGMTVNAVKWVGECVHKFDKEIKYARNS